MPLVNKLVGAAAIRFNQRERMVEVGAVAIRCPSMFNLRERIVEVGAAAIRCPSRFNQRERWWKWELQP